MATVRDNSGEPLVCSAKGSRGADYFITTDGQGVISCTCMSWRVEKKPIKDRSCKHIREALENAQRNRRLGIKRPSLAATVPLSPLPAPPRAPAAPSAQDILRELSQVEKEIASGKLDAARVARFKLLREKAQTYKELLATQAEEVAARLKAMQDDMVERM